jgi:alpha-L-rhamnosidase
MSAESACVEYGGPVLSSRTRYYWTVRVWDGGDEPSAWSEPAWFETAFLKASDWSAKWIGAPSPADGKTSPAPMMRREFTIDGPVRNARLYVCGLGYHDVSINGRPVTDEVLAPAFTPFHKRAEYLVHDVTEALRQGTNAAGVTLGRGWMGLATPSVWDHAHAVWHHEPCLLLQLEIEHEDGSRTTIVSDESWRVHDSPSVRDSILTGETYDARLEQPGWDAPGFDDSAWRPAQVVEAPTQHLVARRHEPIRRIEAIRPVAVSSPRPGTWVFDVGVMIAGWARLRVEGVAGTTVEIRYAERLREDGAVNNDNDIIYEEIQVDRYTLRGNGPECWEPRFSYKGFRYIQLDGYPGTPTLDTLEAFIVHSDVETLGGWESSDELLNTIHRITGRSILNNLHGIPTDTPVYEKNGWTGDAHLTAEPALRNFGIARIHAKWLDDIADSQRDDGLVPLIIPCPGWGNADSPEWGSAYLLVAWYLYQATGDIRILKRHFAGMARYVEFLASQAVDCISPSCLGDWLPPGYDNRDPEGPAVSASAYTFTDSRLLAVMARTLRMPDDAARFDALADRIRDAVNSRFLDKGHGVYSTDRPEVGYRQTPNVLAAAFGITPRDLVPRVVDRLVEDIHAKGDHLDCGILGTKWILPLLTENGHVDLAYRIATQRTYPGWGFWIDRGATALWEAWDLNSRSLDHHMFGSIDEWFFRYLAGINIAAPGYREIVFNPYFPARLISVRAQTETVRGEVASEWTRADGAIHLDVTVPVNAAARVCLPAEAIESPSKAIAIGEQHTRSVYAVGSGKWHFAVHT